MANEKTNIEHLRDILGKDEFESPLKGRFEEALEFLNAIEEEQTEMEDEIKELKKEVSDLEDEKSDLEKQVTEMEENPNEEEIFLGLDTLYYRLEHGNLKIQMQLEHWAELVKKQNAVVPA